MFYDVTVQLLVKSPIIKVDENDKNYIRHKIESLLKTVVNEDCITVTVKEQDDRILLT